MSVWLDEYYLKQLSPQLPLFKAKGTHKYNARCVICGDSQTNRSKARWYAFPHKNVMMTKCHNCGYTQSFGIFLRTVDPALFAHYNIQRMQEAALMSGNLSEEQQEDSHPAKHDLSIFQTLRKVSQLKADHPAHKWILSRRIPSNRHYRLFYTPKFKQFVNGLIPDKYPGATGTDPRIILPLIDSDGTTVIGFQGRSIDPRAQVRYYTIILDTDRPRVFGLEHIDLSRKITVVEGPFDSLFLSNTIASCGSDLASDLQLISNDKSDFIIVYDNEPRNKQIIQKIIQCIDANYSVVIWPDTIDYKDINDMVLSGMQPYQIRNIIKENTFNGLQAKLRLQQWKRG